MQTVSLTRREVIETAETLVIKIGTNVLSCADDTLDPARIELLAEQIHRIKETGRKVVVVSSGAIGAGMGLLGLKERPKDLGHLQASAAVGQAHLIRRYDRCLRKHGYHAAQLLVTANDFKNRTRYLNVRNTIHTLFEYGAVPIVNENDTVSIQEIKFGDNDHLAAMVTSLVKKPLLVILSVVDGLYDGDPKSAGSRRISQVQDWTPELLALATDDSSSLGTGGMKSKLQAVRSATAVGENVIIANGQQEGILDQILKGEDVGTLFLAQGASVSAWKRWIGYTIRPKGKFHLDAGATKAIRDGGKSLLAIGIQSIDGTFESGEAVTLVSPSGEEFARGLSNYNSSDLAKIVMRRSDQIATILGAVPYSEVIHRDNLAVLENHPAL
ncbi:Glutamate 5-kinase [Gimesia fumaroli]|uniref:Glutamate 5-kinase n=1 Tax=Gimesia fumaroli TaxID=2527976 RepID=A0A518IJV2_9PLAN|nr:Glutamate 5-kinase [Gimesia fumaroli]